LDGLPSEAAPSGEQPASGAGDAAPPEGSAGQAQSEVTSPTPSPPQASGQEATGASGTAGIDAATLPHDLSPWNMFVSADVVVQAVMIGLVIASIITWTVWLAKTLELWVARFKTRRALAVLASAPSLGDAAKQLRKGIVAAFVDAALLELNASAGAFDKAGIKERVASRLEGLQVAAGRQMKSGTGLLATIGATAPFVGLFGTVWGIMNSFIGISKAQTTNLAVVAPGIAEALLATALGLAAAIPAVIIYNHFSRSISGYRALVADAAAEVMRQVSRQLDARPASKTASPLPQAAE
jgi:biopolymer transport protein ExbB